MNKDVMINYGAQIIAQSLSKPNAIKFNDIGLREMSQIIEDMNKGVMESLYNEGFIKIEDDEIVIAKRQYKQLKKYNRDRKRLRLKWQQAKRELEQVKEKTAIDILQIVDGRLDICRHGIFGLENEFDNGYKMAIQDIKRLIKYKYGIESED